MVWQRGPTDPDPDYDPPTPWRAGAVETPEDARRRVALEAWDSELTPDELAQRPTVDEVELRQRRRARLLRAGNLALFALAVLGAAAGVAVAWMHVVGDPLADAHAYYEAASRLNAGQPLYPPGIDPSSNHIYLYPPLLAIVLRPLALLPYGLFAVAWELIVLVSFVLLVRYLGVRRRSTWIALGILGIPIGWALSVAQAHVPMTLLMAIGQPWSIAIAANLKLFPALIALWWLGRREWDSLVAFAIWSGLLVLAQLVLEPGGTLSFFNSVGFAQLGEVRNISVFVVSPLAWAALLMLGGLLVILAARTRWGWALAVTLATLAPPRLLVYMLTSLVAGIRKPRAAGEPDPNQPADVAASYVQASR
jgi:alpha-1,2-mannosyltransferase